MAGITNTHIGAFTTIPEAVTISWEPNVIKTLTGEKIFESTKSPIVLTSVEKVQLIIEFADLRNESGDLIFTQEDDSGNDRAASWKQLQALYSKLETACATVLSDYASEQVTVAREQKVAFTSVLGNKQVRVQPRIPYEPRSLASTGLESGFARTQISTIQPSDSASRMKHQMPRRHHRKKHGDNQLLSYLASRRN